MKKFLVLVLLLFLPIIASSECTCEHDSGEDINKSEALKYKIIAMVTILIGGAVGVSLPSLSNLFPALSPEKNMFYMIKAFAAGVILSTGMVHILPHAFEALTSPCLPESPWRKFPFAGFIAMVSAMATLTLEAFATSYFHQVHLRKNDGAIKDDEEKSGEHGYGSGSLVEESEATKDLFRHRVISQVLEMGISIHSVIIGISLGTSQSPNTVKPLVAALSFHQMFEGMGLGGSISQAKLKNKAVILMSVFFSFTTPIGIGIGIGISSIYNENSPKALILDGIFDSASAGILVYMALVDLLAADFMSTKLQSNLRLQLGANFFLLLGVGCMSVLAKWA